MGTAAQSNGGKPPRHKSSLPQGLWCACGLEEPQRIDVVAHQQVFGLLIVIKHHLVVFTADPGLLVATERGVGRVQVIAVGPDTPGLDRPTHAVGAVDVASPQAGAEAELAVVGNRQGFSFVLEGGDAHYRAEDFFLEHAHFVVALEQGRLDVITRRQVALQSLGRATDQQLGALLLGNFQVRENLVVLLLGRLGADHGFGVQRVAALDLDDLLHHLGHERLVDRFLHQRPGRAGADFALVEERQHQAFSGFLDELWLGVHDVFEEDVRRFAAQFNGAWDDVLGGAMHDVRAHRGGTGKRNLGDALAGGQRLTGFATETLDDVQHTGWQQVGDQLGEDHDRQRRLLGGFEHHAVAGSQGRGEFPRGHQQREVPRDDLPDHAQRLVEVIGGGQFVDFGGATFLRTNAPGEVAEMVSSQRHVGVEGFAHGFAVVPGFGDSEDFEVLFDAVSDFQQKDGCR